MNIQRHSSIFLEAEDSLLLKPAKSTTILHEEILLLEPYPKTLIFGDRCACV